MVPLYIYGHHGPLKGAAAQVLCVGHHELHLATPGLLHHLQVWHGRLQLQWGATVELCVGVGCIGIGRMSIQDRLCLGCIRSL